MIVPIPPFRTPKSSVQRYATGSAPWLLRSKRVLHRSGHPLASLEHTGILFLDITQRRFTHTQFGRWCYHYMIYNAHESDITIHLIQRHQSASVHKFNPETRLVYISYCYYRSLNLIIMAPRGAILVVFSSVLFRVYFIFLVNIY